MKTKPYLYMHTIFGRPASYYPPEQICYATPNTPLNLCKDLKQIKREQTLTMEWRNAKGCFPPVDNGKYGWQKVRKP